MTFKEKLFDDIPCPDCTHYDDESGYCKGCVHGCVNIHGSAKPELFTQKVDTETSGLTKDGQPNPCDTIVEEQLERCKSVLCSKAKEYATEDRHHNFHVAAKLQNITSTQALAGMMAKHTVSVYDMCWSGQKYDMALWNEKITDSINYLLLLRTMVEMEADHDAD